MTFDTYPTSPTPTPSYSSETLSSQRTHSSTTSSSSVPVPSAYTRTTGAYSNQSSEQPTSSYHHSQHQHQYHGKHGYQDEHDRPRGDHEETMRESEIERRLRKRDYAVEISRIMGRQLVTAMNKGKGGKGRTVSDG